VSVLRTIFISFISLISFSAFSQDRGSLDSLYGGDVLIADLKELKKVLFESHPNPGGYNDSTQLSLAFLNGEEQVKDGLTLREFIVVVQKILNVQEDSHTTLDMSAVREMAMKMKEKVMPLQLGFNGDVLWVKRDLTATLPKGTIIYSINSIEADSLLKNAKEFSFTEGKAQESRVQVQTAMITSALMLRKQLRDTNMVYCRLPESKADTTIEYISIDKKKVTELLKQSKKKSTSEKFNEVFYVDYYPEEKLAVLTISTFVPVYFQRSEKFLRKTFSQLNKAGFEYLVIDVRDNTGGSSSRVEHLCSYLFEDGHNAPDNIIVRQSELARNRSQKSLGTLKKWIFKLSSDENAKAFLAAHKLPEGAVDTIYFREPIVQRNDLVFKGKCYVLINGLTASAGVDFASAMRRRDRAVIIGQPCMGSGHGTWGNPTMYSMKETHIPLNIATIRYNSDNTFSMSPLPMPPDYIVKALPSTSQIEVDTCLDKVRSLIEDK